MNKFFRFSSVILGAGLSVLAPNVNASSNAQLTVTANVAAGTCDISLSNSNIDLGNFTRTDFKSVATPIPESVKNFTVGLNNCQSPESTGDIASITVSGQTLGGYDNIFNSSGSNTGVMLNLLDSPNAYIKNGEKIKVATAGETPSAADFNNKTLSMQVGLASASLADNVTLGAINAPILFSFAYN
ncbi:hypothetical protein BTJ39_14260 [Izhakiella australiensis]|uniref:Fimbrial-type adhesion domain-containing protein n=1 Tax=Izhakiella australiensis TaxID=1926881 RepID=A0A1S8YKM1_9GAMM|nr:hypothetical protein [Izhakiella australiensis]OON39438.1 hypothetical protein BTJ39_14260 [Izhakiella australiensis]